MPIWKRRWSIPVVVVSVLLVAGIVGGALVAGSDSSSTTDEQNQIAGRYQALLDRACAIYQENTGTVIESEQFKAALEQAQGELQEEALESRLQDLVENGEMTQEEADNYLEWWQSRPHIKAPLPGLGGPGPGGGMTRGGGFQPWGGPPCVPDASGEAEG
jgi:hypothetical protein